ncbi:monosaccharide ABC transporter membrane protein, CUT2 family [Glycomyces sambucus]|uniref:Monosaccharide ABC transporter membrane protein, CUT2 family n=1 Tax=Glycomyces sambucus TaxID=380244 RepID=A0A1G9JM69_9ACTN|nr:ABC transporter permease [Glycomyces sambucus]SDL38619.1 monosaccharide ABC transporter membrane protein, CUT2 family [Glycomyces sambucus]
MNAYAKRLLWPVLILLALIAVNIVATGVDFIVPSVNDDGRLGGAFVNILRRSAPLLLIALGMTLVIATKGIDLSVGAVYAIGAAIACQTIIDAPDQTAGGLVLAAVALALAATAAIGAWNGVMVAHFGIQPIVATLVLMIAGRGIAQLVTGGQIPKVQDASPFTELGRGAFLTVPIPIWIAALVLTALALLTRRTALGMLLESVGGNPEASRLAGIRSRGITVLVYLVCGLCAGLAGLIGAANLGSADANNGGLWIELDAILAVVIGGTALLGGRFFLLGTAIGVVIIGTLEDTIINVGLSSQWQFTAKAVVVFAVALLQSPEFRGWVLRPLRRRPEAPAPAQAEEAAS